MIDRIFCGNYEGGKMDGWMEGSVSEGAYCNVS